MKFYSILSIVFDECGKSTDSVIYMWKLFQSNIKKAKFAQSNNVCLKFFFELTNILHELHILSASIFSKKLLLCAIKTIVKKQRTQKRRNTEFIAH